MKKTRNNIIEELHLISEGILKHLPELESIGLKEKDALEFKEYKAVLERLNAEQEELKALAKLKTEEINNKIEEIQAKYSDARKMVKIKIDQKSWIAFGIEDKR